MYVYVDVHVCGDDIHLHVYDIHLRVCVYVCHILIQIRAYIYTCITQVARMQMM